MNPESRSIRGLISDGLEQLTALLRNEIQIAKLEMTRKAATAAVPIAMIIGSLAFAIATVVMLLTTIATFFIAAGVGPGVSFLLATIVGGLLTGGLAWAGIQRLKSGTLMPERAVRQVKMDAQAAKGLAS
jgi:hypothetical protein